MVDGVEEAADVRVEHPVRPLLDDDRRERIQGLVRRPPGAEAIRETQKRSFVDGLQDHAHGLLHDLVLQSRNSDRPLPPIRLRDMHPSHGKRVIAAAVDPVLQVREASFEMLAVLAPRDPIHPGCRFLLQASIRLRQKRHLQVAHQVAELRLLVLRCLASDPLQVRGRACPALGPERVSWCGFSLGLAPSLHRLGGRYPRLRRFHRYYGLVRLPGSLRPRLVDSPFPRLPDARHGGRRGASGVSRFPCREYVRACRALRLRMGGVVHRAHSIGPRRVAFHLEESVGPIT